MNAHEVFEQEWKLYKGRGEREEVRGEGEEIRGERGEVRGERGDEWLDVKIGEFRIFADMDKPLVALVTEGRGAAGYQIVPVSPFSVPASEREMLVGDRVLQLWNACIAAKALVERSWVVDVATSEDIAEIRRKIPAAMPGRLTAGDSAQSQYEREFLVAGGAFQPLAKSRAVAKFPMLSRVGYSLAAMLVMGLGVAWLVVSSNDGAKTPRCVAEKNFVDIEARKAVLDLDEGFAEEEAPEEAAEVDSLDLVAADIPMPIEPQVAPMVCAIDYSEPAKAPQQVSVRPASQDVVAIISSPVKMKTMVGSRTPADTYASARRSYSPAPALAKPAREAMYANDVQTTVTFEGGEAEFTTSLARGTERFADFRENEFLDPRNEPLSTFGLDVDTSSYTLMRSYVMDQGRRPPTESVRLAEYVNYFKYDYAQPTGAVPLAADCELAQCPWNAAHKLLRVGVQAKSLDEAAMPPCNLTFLVDCSGSMSANNGMALLKNGLLQLVKKLRPVDHVSIVTYASGCEVRLASTPGSDKDAIMAAIYSLSAFGCTYGGAGLQLAYEEAQRNFDKAANNRVILVTDGDFNVGISSPRELEEFIAKKRDTGIFLSVIGVGCGNFQDAAMKRLANAGNGNYAYLDSPLEAKKVMSSEFGGTLFTVAKDVKVQIEFNPAAVASYRLLGYESRILEAKDFNDDKKDAGEVGSGHSMTAFYEIVPAGEAAGADAVDPLKYQKPQMVESPEMFTLKMRWKKPDADSSEKIEMACTGDQIMKAEPGTDFRFASAVAEFALILENSKFKGDAKLERVFERARASKGADRDGYRAEFVRLVELLLLQQ